MQSTCETQNSAADTLSYKITVAMKMKVPNSLRSSIDD